MNARSEGRDTVVVNCLSLSEYQHKNCTKYSHLIENKCESLDAAVDESYRFICLGV